MNDIIIITPENFNFEMLYLTKDSEYGTHVCYCDIIYNHINKKSFEIKINYWTDKDRYDEIIADLIYHVNLEIIKQENVKSS